MFSYTATEANADFLSWYSEFCMDENLERATSRFELCRSVLREFKKNDISLFLEILFDGKKSVESLDTAKTLFQRHDPMFARQGNDREVKVLAAIVIALLAKSEGRLALVTAMSIQTASLGKGRKLIDVPLDLLQIASDATFQLSVDKRKRKTLSLPRKALDDLNALRASLRRPSEREEEEEEEEEKEEKEENTEGTSEDQPKADEEDDEELLKVSTIRKLLDAASALASEAQQTWRDISWRQELQDEELDILWWLYGERCDDGRAFKTVAEAERSLIFAKELAKKVKHPPGPVSISSILLKAGVGEEKTSIVTAVDAVSATWINSTAQDNLDALVFPIHTALACRKEFGTSKNWKSTWNAKTSVAKTHGISSLELSKLFFLESLLRNMN